jgi:hypothetical protein
MPTVHGLIPGSKRTKVIMAFCMSINQNPSRKTTLSKTAGKIAYSIPIFQAV